MNRLILLGNGFDLAHGMKTKYSDFILEYLKASFLKAHISDKKHYLDNLIEVRKNGKPYNYEEVIPNWNFDYFLSCTVDNRWRYLNKATELDGFYLKIQNAFMEDILDECSSMNWVNIENKYYKHLKKLILKTLTSGSRSELVSNLNSSMDSIVDNLNNYFHTQSSSNHIAAYETLFNQQFEQNDFARLKTSSIQSAPSNIHILNFNYTDTVERYISKDQRIELNYIHGRAADQENPIIFGFGDEMDDHYQQIESSSIKGILKYVKSFGYFRTSNYFNLVRFLDSDTFQVFILGHSCGLSDRTMLNMIFEHTNCLSIKIFYYENSGINNYRETTEEISRHFRNKVLMRTKIVPLAQSSKMPQFDS